MPWVIRDVVKDINKAVARRWHGLDALLPQPSDLPEGCMAPLVSHGDNGRPAGLGVCRHQHLTADTLAQTWGAATKFVLSMRLRGPDVQAAADDLLTQWREHLTGLPEARKADTAAIVNWPARDVTGVLALLRHGLQPMSVIAVRPAGRSNPASHASMPPGLVIRPAGPDDLDAVTELEMGVVRYDAHFGGSIPRPATEALVRAETQAALARRPGWTWLAEQAGRAVALAVVEPPADATLDRGHGPDRRRGLPADHVRTPRRARRRDRRGPGPARARRARRPRCRPHPAALRPGEPAVGAVLAPDGIPAAVVHLGGAPGSRPALTTSLTASKCLISVQQRRPIALGHHGQGMIEHESAGMLSAT